MIDCNTCSVLDCQFNSIKPKKSCEMYKPYMTPKNALHCMKFNCEIALCEDCDIYGTVGTDHCFEDACREAIKALEKQIPKEIEQFIVDGKMGRRCPNGCGITSVTMWATINYCPYCGQAIKWE